MTKQIVPIGVACDLACKIADDLMMSGLGKRAERLVLVDDKGNDLGGWNNDALTGRIVQHLLGKAITLDKKSQ